MPSFLTLLRKNWWTYPSADVDWFSQGYHAFNLGEGAAWCALGALVLRRFFKHRRSPVEVAYALAFVAFGATDFREAYALDSWLIALKFANLVCLVLLRAYVIRNCYPGSKTY